MAIGSPPLLTMTYSRSGWTSAKAKFPSGLARRSSIRAPGSGRNSRAHPARYRNRRFTRRFFHDRDEAREPEPPTCANLHSAAFSTPRGPGGLRELGTGEEDERVSLPAGDDDAAVEDHAECAVCPPGRRASIYVRKPNSVRARHGCEVALAARDQRPVLAPHQPVAVRRMPRLLGGLGRRKACVWHAASAVTMTPWRTRGGGAGELDASARLRIASATATTRSRTAAPPTSQVSGFRISAMPGRGRRCRAGARARRLCPAEGGRLSPPGWRRPPTARSEPTPARSPCPPGRWEP